MILWSSIAHFVALVSPGPDAAITLKEASLNGRRAGILAAFGIGIGIFIHCLLAVNGISLIIVSNSLYKMYVSLLGGAYLFYIGVNVLRTKSKRESNNKFFFNSSFINGLITNIFNIKAFMFFVSLFTVLIDSITPFLFYFFPIYFSITSALWFIFLSYVVTIPNKTNIDFFNNIYFKYLTSLIFIFLGLFIIITSIYEYL